VAGTNRGRQLYHALRSPGKPETRVGEQPANGAATRSANEQLRQNVDPVLERLRDMVFEHPIGRF
jgi:hypothetical protein